MGRPKGSKNKPKGTTTPVDPSGLRAVGAKLAADEKQAKLPIVSADVAVSREDVELPVALAETEVEHARAQVMALEVEITAHAKDLEALQAEARDKSKTIAKKRREVSKLSTEAHTRVRMLVVPVRIEHDYPRGQVRYYRLDRGVPEVGELYDTKAMPPEEREKALFKAPPPEERIDLDDDAEAPAEQSETDASDEPDVNAKGGDA